MKISLLLPIGASAKFTADVAVEGKTAEEVLDEFLTNCEVEGYLCHQCSSTVSSDLECIDVDDMLHADLLLEVKENL